MASIRMSNHLKQKIEDNAWDSEAEWDLKRELENMIGDGYVGHSVTYRTVFDLPNINTAKFFKEYCTDAANDLMTFCKELPDLSFPIAIPNPEDTIRRLKVILPIDLIDFENPLSAKALATTTIELRTKVSGKHYKNLASTHNQSYIKDANRLDNIGLPDQLEIHAETLALYYPGIIDIFKKRLEYWTLVENNASIRRSVYNLVNQCTTLKQFLTIWPQGESLVPQSTMVKYHEKTKPRAKKEIKDVDMTNAQTSIFRRQLGV